MLLLLHVLRKFDGSHVCAFIGIFLSENYRLQFSLAIEHPEEEN